MQKVAGPLWMSVILLFVMPYALADSYPNVKPFEQTFNVPDVSKTNVALEIRSTNGSSLYRLQCHSAGYGGDPDFDYSGDFECRLTSINNHDRYSTLLTEDSNQSRDWESRGRFFAADLRDPCAEIPQFGAERSFELRGMKLILKISDPTFTKEQKLHSLRLTVKVSRDPEARRPIASIVPLPKTGVPAMCKLNEYFIDPATFSQ